MATRAPFLKTRYGGYFHREVPEEDAELTHVGPDTPCGEYLRRFWQPICFSDELKDLPSSGQNPRRGTGGISRPERRRRSCWNCIVRIAARLWSSGWSTPAAYDAAIMAGCSRPTGRSLRRPASRLTAP